MRFAELLRALRDGDQIRFALAELNDLLAGLTLASCLAPLNLRT
jgi:hypothetical protein